MELKLGNAVIEKQKDGVIDIEHIVHDAKGCRVRGYARIA